jgi:hypothetical protein
MLAQAMRGAIYHAEGMAPDALLEVRGEDRMTLERLGRHSEDGSCASGAGLGSGEEPLKKSHTRSAAG